MSRNSCDLIPRTYSVKSFRRKQGFRLKKFIMYLAFIALLFAVLGISFLTVMHLI